MTGHYCQNSHHSEVILRFVYIHLYINSKPVGVLSENRESVKRFVFQKQLPISLDVNLVQNTKIKPTSHHHAEVLKSILDGGISMDCYGGNALLLASNNQP